MLSKRHSVSGKNMFPTIVIKKSCKTITFTPSPVPATSVPRFHKEAGHFFLHESHKIVAHNRFGLGASLILISQFFSKYTNKI